MTPRVSCCSSRLHPGAQPHSANIAGAAGRGVAPARSLRGWIPLLPPQTSVQMLTGVARLDFRYERQRVRVELLGKRHRESQSLIGIPGRDESPRLPVPARAERGHWSRVVKATHSSTGAGLPYPGDSQLSRLGLSLPTSLMWGSSTGERPCPCIARRLWGLSGAAPIPVLSCPVGLDSSVFLWISVPIPTLVEWLQGETQGSPRAHLTMARPDPWREVK